MQMNVMVSAASDDTELVQACLGGDRDAFAWIVTRYQALVASVAYNATGNVAQSEDLAQETFLVAWQRLKQLEQPGKLRAWLCGIARRTAANARRRQRREPSEDARPLEQVLDAPAVEPLPAEHAITREEEALLWRSLEGIPEIYREPLILYFREDQSVDNVAAALELTEDTVRQRLSRGRKLLEKRIAAFVEGALRQSVPGSSFTAGVMAQLPAQLAGAGLATAGAAAAKGGAAKTAGWFVGLTALISFLPGAVSTYLGYKGEMADASSDEARRSVRRSYLAVALSVLLPVALLYLAVAFARLVKTHPTPYSAFIVAIAISWIPCGVIVLALMKRRLATTTNADPSKAVPVLEYRSSAQFLGLPLFHLRFFGPVAVRCRPVKAWIALGDFAFGGLFAFGGIAIAPLSFGGFALGAAVLGGYAAGLLTYAGFGIGLWTIGGIAIGWWSVGGCAVASSAALGGIALARTFALGGVAIALHTNDAAANAYIQHNLFFQIAYQLVTTWLWPTMLLLTVPSVLLSIAGKRKRFDAA
jgi:RNA polymerase sigma factor (sigma-70 family)